MANNKTVLFAPFVLGVLLLSVSALDLYQFRVATVEIHTLLLRELPIVLLGLVSTLGVSVAGMVYLVSRQWCLAALSLLSALSFVFCFLLGGELGAAYLNAA